MNLYINESAFYICYHAYAYVLCNSIKKLVYVRGYIILHCAIKYNISLRCTVDTLGYQIIDTSKNLYTILHMAAFPIESPWNNYVLNRASLKT